jgi:hypothetical protein
MALRKVTLNAHVFDKTGRPVLFIIRVWNLSTYPGFRINHTVYTTFQQEKEHVLPQDMKVFVYGVEDIPVQNFCVKSLNDKTITAIYLDAFNY